MAAVASGMDFLVRCSAKRGQKRAASQRDFTALAGGLDGPISGTKTINKRLWEPISGWRSYACVAVAGRCVLFLERSRYMPSDFLADTTLGRTSTFSSERRVQVQCLFRYLTLKTRDEKNTLKLRCLPYHFSL